MGLIITGMHRSGTSAVARVVEAMGLFSNGPHMASAPDNPRGFFERPDVMQVNDSWLGDLGGSWWAPPATSPATWRNLDQAKLAADRSSLDLFDPDQGPWYVKDPRISLLMPLWDRFALQPLPVVLTIRDPREIASSLLLRNGMPPRRALAVWFAYVNSAIAAAHDRSLLVLDYDQLVSNPTAGLDALGQFLTEHAGAPTPLPTLEALLPLVEPSLRRNHSIGDLGVAASEVEDALDTYMRLAKSHADPSAAPEEPQTPTWAQELLDEIRETYAAEETARAATILISRLEQELQRAADPAEEIRTLEEELRRAHLEHDSLTARLTEFETTLESERKAHTASRQQAEESERTASALTAQVQAKEQELVVLDQEINRLRMLLTESEERTAGSIRQAEAQSRASDQRIAKLNNALLAARTEERNATEQVTQLLDELTDSKSALHQANTERDTLQGQTLAVTQLSENLSTANSELLATVNDLRHRLAASEGQLAAQSEMATALTETIMKERAKAARAEQQLSETKALAANLQTQLNQQTTSVERLTAALTRALGAGQSLAEELDGIKASRTYRLRQRFARESETTEAPPHFIPDIEPSLITEAIASGLFDPHWYAQHNPDVVETGVDPTHHYFTQGWREGRQPSVSFIDIEPPESELPDDQREIAPPLQRLTTERSNNAQGKSE